MGGSLFIAVALLINSQSGAQREARHVEPVTAVFDNAPIKDVAMSVVVARVGTDGKPILACVDTKEAARRFLEAPADQLSDVKKEK